MLKVNKAGEGVYVAGAELVLLGQEAIDLLKTEASQVPLRRARICAHSSNDDPIHEMLMVMASDTYVRPHKHSHKAESNCVIEGCADMIIFKEDGEISTVIHLEKDKDFFIRIPENTYHALIVKSPYFVFHEVQNGPFVQGQLENALFAPPADDKEQVKQYISNLKNILDTHFKH